MHRLLTAYVRVHDHVIGRYTYKLDKLWLPALSLGYSWLYECMILVKLSSQKVSEGLPRRTSGML